MTRYVNEKIHYASFIKKRFKRVMIPYFSISTLTIVSRFFLEKYKITPLTETVYTPLDIKKIIIDFFFAGAAQHYYFLISIFIIYCIFPFIKKFFKGKYSCLLLFIGYQVIYPLLIAFYEQLKLTLPSPDVFSHALWGLKFFLIGMILFHYLDYIRKYINRYGFFFFLTFIAVALIMHTHNLPYSSYVLIVAYFCLAFFLEQWTTNKIILLGKLTFGIYLFHQPYFVKISTIIATKIELSNWPLVLVPFFLTTITTTVFIILFRRLKFFKITFLGER
jgi:hypothetical protein